MAKPSLRELEPSILLIFIGIFLLVKIHISKLVIKEALSWKSSRIQVSCDRNYSLFIGAITFHYEKSTGSAT
jgi:hypothetical protein